MDGRALEAEIRESHIRNSNPNGKDFVKNWNSCLDMVSQTFKKIKKIQEIRNEEQQRRLILGRNGITIGDKIYKTLSNIRALNPITIKDDELLSALAQVGNDYDSALILSALLSLATDFRTLIKILY